MAYLGTRKNGSRYIQFTTPAEKTETLSLGKCSKRDGETVLVHVRALIAARRLGTPIATATQEWLTAAPDEVKERLVTTGIFDWEAPSQLSTLGPFLDEYKRSRCKTHKPASIVVWNSVIRNLLIHFGADRPIDRITHADAEAFHEYLVADGLQLTTIQKRISHVRMFFSYAKRLKLISENPFEYVKTKAGDVTARRAYISTDIINRVIDEAPNVHWKLLIALARYGGLRCPSEPLSLKWSDIDWAKGRVTVHSPKTEHLAGKAYRVIPLFPELRPYLEAAWDATEEGAADFIFPQEWRERAQGAGGWANANFRTTLLKIIKRAGLQSWPKLFHNLRASRETDLAATFPIHVVTSWLGNTPDIALKHYLTTVDADFTKALGDPVGVLDTACQNPTDHALAYALVKVSETPRNGKNDTILESVKTLELPVSATLRGVSQIPQAERTGFEPADPGGSRV